MFRHIWIKQTPKTRLQSRISSNTKREKYGKRVCEIDSANNILMIWDSIAEASEATGLDRFKISNVCKTVK